MKRFLLAIGLTFFLPQLIFSQKEKNEKPHVLFIAIDDLRPDLGCYGNKEVKSPNIDILASEGMVFDRAYCQQAVCGPSRLSVMTSMHPDRFGLWGMAGEHVEWRDDRKGMTSLTEQFRLNGYKAYGFGKIYDYRLGIDLEHSWDDFKNGNKSQFHDKEKHIRDKRSIYGNYPAKAAYAAEEVDDEVYSDGNIARLAMNKLKEHNANEPLFLAVGFLKPHLPFVAPQKYFDLYNVDSLKLAERRCPPEWHTEFLFSWLREINFYDVPYPIPESMQRELIQAYYACVSYVDKQIGKIIEVLKEKDMYDNTIIVLWGDHGYKLGEHGEYAKHTNTEHDARVPLIIRAPGKYQANVKTKSLVELVDMYPTICELASVPVPDNIEGISLIPILKNSQQTIRDFALTQYPMVRSTMSYSIRTDNWRYIETRSDISGEPIAAELYDMRNSNIEIKNDLNNYPEVAKEHAAMLDKYLKNAIKWKGGNIRTSW